MDGPPRYAGLNMGMVEDNLYLRVHVMGLGEPEYTLRRHRGNQGVDTRSGKFGRAEYDSLKDAAKEGILEFSDVAREVLGPWWDSIPGPSQDRFREVLLAL